MKPRCPRCAAPLADTALGIALSAATHVCKALRPVVKRGTGRVVLDGHVLGRVFQTSSGAVWGALSCTPRLRVYAFQVSGSRRYADGSAETQRRAVEQLLRAVDLDALGFNAEEIAQVRGQGGTP